MATDIKIDPRTRDFVDDGAGGWVETNDSSTAVLMQLDCEEGSWWGDPLAGSQVAAVMRAEIQTPDQVQAAIARAMAAMVRGGLISDVAVSITYNDGVNGAAAFLNQWRDRASSQPGDLAYSPLGSHP